MEGIDGFGAQKAMKLKSKTVDTSNSDGNPGSQREMGLAKKATDSDSDDSADSETQEDQELIESGSSSDDEDDEDEKQPISAKGKMALVRKSKIYVFVSDDLEWSVICFVTHMIVWAYGGSLYYDYGYSDTRPDLTLNENDAGNIPSGPNGSGALVVSSLVMICVSAIWLLRYIVYDPYIEHPEKEEILEFKEIFVRKRPNPDAQDDIELQRLNSDEK